jgi:curved DNA-binding protein
VPPTEPNHYHILGLDEHCTEAHIRAAYRLLARQHHPDVNAGSPESLARTQQLNAAYEILGDPVRRLAYDEALAAARARPPVGRGARGDRNVTTEVWLRCEEFLRGTQLEVQVNDPANPDGPETYPLTIPPETAPGARFRLSRAGAFAGGIVLVRVKARPDARFKVRGSDLRCDLRLRPQRAAQGGVEQIRGVAGRMVPVPIPLRAARGEVVRIPGEGLPRPRGGRGDLLVRLCYTPEVRVRRARG